jgi:DNA-binding LacI/PurR family transcriptional regulator
MMSSTPSQTLARLFRQKIAEGQWVVGKQLPTTRELSLQFQVSVNTVQSAFRYLEADDLVERRPRRGGFVKAHPKGARGAMTPVGASVAIIAEAVSKDVSREGNNWCHRIARAAERELSGASCHVSLLSWAIDDPAGGARLRARVEEIKQSLAGVICFPMPDMASVVERFEGLGIPCVSINRPTRQSVEDFVAADNVDGGRMVGHCFGRLHVGRVVVLGEAVSPGNSTMEKFAGLLEGCLETGMASRDVDFVPCRGFHAVDGYDAFRAHVDRFGPPGAVFALGDFLALGALQLCRERGWDVGREVSIVGATGLDVAKYSYPSLTVLEQPMDRMGEEAAKTLTRMIAAGRRHAPGTYIKSTLVFRQSFRPPPEVVAEVGGVVDEGL